jgi:hypothetical protein
MKTIKLEDEMTKELFEFPIQPDNSVSFENVKMIFGGDIRGIKSGNVCLTITGDKVFPIDDWKNETYVIIGPKIKTEFEVKQGINF